MPATGIPVTTCDRNEDSNIRVSGADAQQSSILVLNLPMNALACEPCKYWTELA
jgi:hypothetical protein